VSAYVETMGGSDETWASYMNKRKHEHLLRLFAMPGAEVRIVGEPED